MIIPNWLIFALVSAFFSGMNNFFKKVSAHNKNDANLVVFYFNLFSFIFSGIFMFIFFREIILNWTFWFIIVIVAILNVVNIKFKILSLKKIDTSIHFVVTRFSIVIILSIFGSILFDELVTLKEWVGILVGFLVFYLLIDIKGTNTSKENLVTGLLYTLVVVICVSLISISKKYILIFDYDMFAYLFFVFLISFFISMFMNNGNFKSKLLFRNKDNVILFTFLQASFNLLAQIFGFFALETGKITIISKVSSYSIFIPILLSIIIYKEKITFKRVIALFLTVMSLWFFI